MNPLVEAAGCCCCRLLYFKDGINCKHTDFAVRGSGINRSEAPPG